MMANRASQWRKGSKIRYNRAMRDFKLIATVLIMSAAMAAPAFAQSMIPLDRQQQANVDRQRNLNLEPALQYKPPAEPVFEKVAFLKLDPPRSLRERIESLIHGVYVDIPPEYDHFGYEVRRYMASVAGPKILASQTNLKGQIKNIKTAEIVLKYWQEKHQKEVNAIGTEIEERDESSSIRTSFKYHRGVAQAFFVEANSWTRNNRAMLEYLVEIGPEAYTFKEHVFMFNDQKHLRKYASLFKAQQEALKEIQGYTPFRMMVY